MSALEALKEIPTVFGYVRTNYHGNVPEAIIRLCLHYFNQNYLIQFKGKKLKELWSMKTVQCYRYIIKFNHDISFEMCIVPRYKVTGLTDMETFTVASKLESMSKTIDYIIVAYEFSCFDFKSLDRNIKFFRKIYHENTNKFHWHLQSIGLSSQFKDIEPLSSNFKITSLQIKYKTEEIIYYPSLSAVKFKETSSLKWNVSKALIDILKTYPHRAAYTGPIVDNLCVVCGPNGLLPSDVGYFVHGVSLTTFPKDILKMTVQLNIITELEDDKFEEEYKRDLHHDKKWVIGAPRFLNSRLKGRLSYDVTFYIEALYNLKGDEVPKNEWIDHNVLLSE